MESWKDDENTLTHAKFALFCSVVTEVQHISLFESRKLKKAGLQPELEPKSDTALKN